MTEDPSGSAGLTAPDAVIELAEQRAQAREAADWPHADELKLRIEAAGWRVVDSGVDYRLLPLRPPDINVGGRTLYGHVGSVPSLLGAPSTTEVALVLPAQAPGATLARMVAAAAEHAPEGTPLIVVTDGSVGADDESGDVDWSGLEASELILTAGPFGPAAALEAGTRRASSDIIVALMGKHVPEGDFVGPLVAALADPTIGVAGAEGLRSGDLHRFDPAGPGPVTAVTETCLAFRRADLISRGPLDDRLRLSDSLATWWSLVLRDEGEGVTPRTALAIELPLAAPDEAVADEPRDRDARRDRYRISDRFGGRSDLATA